MRRTEREDYGIRASRASRAERGILRNGILDSDLIWPARCGTEMRNGDHLDVRPNSGLAGLGCFGAGVPRAHR